MKISCKNHLMSKSFFGFLRQMEKFLTLEGVGFSEFFLLDWMNEKLLGFKNLN